MRDRNDNGFEPRCAICKQETSYCRNLVAEGMIRKMPATCEYCGAETTRETLVSHVQECSSAPRVSCSRQYAGCRWTGKESERVKHEAECQIVRLCENVTGILTNKDHTSMFVTVQHSLIGFVELLLQHDKEFNAKKEQVLCYGAMRGDEELVKLLLLKGVNVNTGSLHCATNEGHVKVVKMLLDIGADVNIDTSCFYDDGYTPLQLAIENEDELGNETTETIVRMLLDAGANVINTPLRPLSSAVSLGQLAIVKMLIEAGSDVNNGESGISVSYYGNPAGYTPLHWAAQDFRQSLIKVLLEAGAEVDKPDTKGRTPLHIAAGSQFLSHADYDEVSMTVKALLEAGADVNKADRKGRTSLHKVAVVAEEASIEMQQIQYRIDDKNYIEVMNILFEAGADVNKVDEHGDTPLHIALRRVREALDISIVRALLEAGADVNKANKKNITPLHMHSRNNLTDIYQHYNVAPPRT